MGPKRRGEREGERERRASFVAHRAISSLFKLLLKTGGLVQENELQGGITTTKGMEEKRKLF